MIGRIQFLNLINVQPLSRQPSIKVDRDDRGSCRVTRRSLEICKGVPFVQKCSNVYGGR